MSKVTLAGRGVIVASILAALLIPAAALAGPGQGDAHSQSTSRSVHPAAAAVRPAPAGRAATPPSAESGQPPENLARRVANVLAARKKRFDAASTAISAHVARVGALADRVEAAGGDVAEVRGHLADATEALAAANTLEDEAAAKVQALPGSSSRKADLVAARASGAGAVAQLKLARAKVVLAVHELRAVAKAAKTPSETSDSP
jgi:hypothetical protein